MAVVGGRIDGPIAAKLLMASAFVDLVAVLLLTKIIGRFVTTEIGAMSKTPDTNSEGILSILLNAPNEVIFLLCFVGIFVLYWALLETIFGGRAIGRTLLGLHMCTADGSPLGSGRRMTRGLRKLTSLGLPGLQVSGPPRYDRNSGCFWHSPMVPRSVGPIETWKLVLLTPDGKRKSVRLAQIGSFRSSKTIKIGRDPNWADLVLPANSRASAKHCILSVQNGTLKLLDNNSSNGTFWGGKRLEPKMWVPLSGKDKFQAADVKIKFQQ